MKYMLYYLDQTKKMLKNKVLSKLNHDVLVYN